MTIREAQPSQLSPGNDEPHQMRILHVYKRFPLLLNSHQHNPHAKDLGIYKLQELRILEGAFSWTDSRIASPHASHHTEALSLPRRAACLHLFTPNLDRLYILQVTQHKEDTG